MKSKSFIFIYLLITQLVHAQPIKKGDYLFPIMPGKQNFLTGNMGELRPGHFHAGLDIKTKGREGLPVYAAADGYVARVVVGERGYGKVVYLKHANGHTTVYAHNKTFEPKLDSLVRASQYLKKSFDVDLDLYSKKLFYKKGAVIAYSGNSGSSGGPHLHFEIRDSVGDYLNPLFNQYNEVRDTRPPFISKVALKSLDRFSRINNEFGRHELSFKKTKPNEYIGKDTVYVSQGHPIGLEVNTYDLMDGIYNLQGVNYITVAVDDSVIFDFSLEKFSYEESHCIHAHVDFETLRRKGSWYHKCYIADGNIIQAYKTKKKGHIVLHDTTRAHKVTVAVRDYNNNASTLTFYISAKPHQLFYRVPAIKLPILKRILPPKRKMTEQLFENVLKLEYSDHPDNMNLLAELHVKGKIIPLAPSYMKGDHITVYLINLKQYLPDSLSICDFVYPLHFKKMIVPKQKSSYTHDNISLNFTETTLFDTLYLRFIKTKDNFTINDYTIPFKEHLGINIDNLNALEDKLHTSAYADAGKMRLSFAGGKWASDSASLYFKTKGPGTYTLARDIFAPNIRVLKKTKKEITFKASDAASGIAKYECYVDSNWVLMNYDYKRSFFWSEKLDNSVSFKGDVSIRVTDNVGNVKEEKFKIK